MATIIGTNGNDSLFGTGGDDQIFGLAGNDVLQGGAGANNLFGGTGDDILYNDVGTSGGFISRLVGGAGADEIHGAQDSVDYLSYADSSAGVTVNLIAGTASGGDAQGDVFSLTDGVIGSAFNDVLSTGTVLASIFVFYLEGGAGNDVLTLSGAGGTMQGGPGADTLIGYGPGRLGDSVVVYTDSSSGVTVDLATGTGTGDAEGDVLQNIDRVNGSQHDDVLIGSGRNDNLGGAGGDDVLRGGTGADSLSGDAGDDVLRGGAGADRLFGGDGMDTADYSLAAARVAMDLVTGGTAGEATGDRYQSIEILRGTNLNDSLVGDANANVLEGGAGADTLDGRGGSDTASYAHSAAGVTVSLTTGIGLGGDAQGDTLTGFENLRGTAFADILAGDTGDNTLEGGAGADGLYGGAGVDTVSYAHSAAGVQVDVYAETATGGDAEGDTLIGIENLIGSDHDDVLKLRSGGGGILSGGAGDDTLKGAGSVAILHQGDIFDGGSGFDMVLVNDSDGSWVDLQIGIGLGGFGVLNDTFISIEGLTGSTTADRLLGNDADNIFYGAEGRDILSGRNGADILSGGYAGDQLDGGSGSDIASYYTSISAVAVNLTTGTASGGDAQGDTLTSIEGLSGSNLGNDSLAGNAGANALQGWGGDDALTGAGGKDTLIGGAGADRFIYGSVAESATGVDADVIVDFSHGQGDRIDLSVIDANTGVAGNQAFSFIGTAAYTGVAGQLRFLSDGAVTVIGGDVNGDGVSDFNIRLTGAIGLVAADFVL
jgi:Ca2+-binding RTX toxin-like protein